MLHPQEEIPPTLKDIEQGEFISRDLGCGLLPLQADSHIALMFTFLFLAFFYASPQQEMVV